MKKILLGVLSLGITVCLHAQKIIYVNSANTSGVYDGTTWATAYDNLKLAIDGATTNDSVFVANGTYQPASGQSFSMKTDVKIYGGFIGTETSLSERNLTGSLLAGDSSLLIGNGSCVISNNNNSLTATAVLDGFTITGGNNTSTDGGGMYNNVASPTITHCIFSGNTTAGSGGGMFNKSASPTISHCSFTGNTAAVVGGGLYIASSPLAAVSNCTFTSNTAGSGGGMYPSSCGPITVTNCTFTGNTVDNYGGGMDIFHTPLIMTNCTFSGNSAPYGGGVLNDGASPTITNCFFTANKGLSAGGGMYNETSSSPTLVNCTFTDNMALSRGGAGGGGMHSDVATPTIINCTFSHNSSTGAGSGGMSIKSAPSTVTNCVFWGNTGGGATDITNDGSTLTINYSYTQTDFTASSTGNVTSNTDPFVNSGQPSGADGIYGTTDDGLHLNYTAGYFAVGLSPIDAGNNAVVPTSVTTDIAGALRIQNTTVDMGAYEEGIPLALFIDLTSFTGSLQNGLAKLNWQSGVESEFNHFEVEQSAGSTGAFTRLANLAAKGSNSSYTYSAAQPISTATAYYRLKMVNKDGSSKYSHVVQLSQNSNRKVLIYPSPAQSYIHIQVEHTDTGSIRIYDASGRLVKKQEMRPGENKIDVSGWNAGVYYGVADGIKFNFTKQ